MSDNKSKPNDEIIKKMKSKKSLQSVLRGADDKTFTAIFNNISELGIERGIKEFEDSALNIDLITQALSLQSSTVIRQFQGRLSEEMASTLSSVIENERKEREHVQMVEKQLEQLRSMGVPAETINKVVRSQSEI